MALCREREQRRGAERHFSGLYLQAERRVQLQAVFSRYPRRVSTVNLAYLLYFLLLQPLVLFPSYYRPFLCLSFEKRGKETNTDEERNRGEQKATSGTSPRKMTSPGEHSKRRRYTSTASTAFKRSASEKKTCDGTRNVARRERRNERGVNDIKKERNPYQNTQKIAGSGSPE